MKHKCALILRGLCRDWEKAYPSFAQNFLDRYDTDVFIDVWSDIGFYTGVNAYRQETTEGYVDVNPQDKGYHADGKLVNINKLWEWYKPKTMYIEDFLSQEGRFDERKKYFVKAYTRPKNTIAQFYKIASGMRHMEEYAANNNIQYDFVVSARPDLILQEELPMLEKNVFYTILSRNKKNGGTGDSIQIGSFLDMLAFATIYYDLENIYDTLGYSCPHSFTEYAAKQFNWKELATKATIVHSPSGKPYAEPNEI
jgi:hypothetical protein